MVDFNYVDADDFIDLLLEQNDLGLNDTYNYAENHYNELKNLDRIFDYKTSEDKERCIALAKLLTPKWAKEIIDYSKNIIFNKTGLSFVEESKANKYTTELLSAFIYNPTFLKKAWDWCVIAYQEAKEQYNKSKEKTILDNNIKYETITLTIVTVIDKESIYMNKLRNPIIHPGANKKGFFVYETICLNHNGICGKLIIYGNHQNQVDIKFKFDEPQKNIPFKLKFCFKTKKDEKEYEILLPADINSYDEDTEDNISTIKSHRINNIKFLDGIDGDYKLIVIQSDNKE